MIIFIILDFFLAAWIISLIIDRSRLVKHIRNISRKLERREEYLASYRGDRKNLQNRIRHLQDRIDEPEDQDDDEAYIRKSLGVKDV